MTIIRVFDSGPVQCGNPWRVRPTMNNFSKNVYIFILLLIHYTLADGPAAIGDDSNRFNKFDWELSKLVAYKERSNVILSPISAKLVLAMLYEGANGTTAQQLQSVLNLDKLFASNRLEGILKNLQGSTDGYDIAVGTKLFIDKDAVPKKNFEDKIKVRYNGTIEKIDFKKPAEAVQKINSWAESITRGHISQLLDDVDTQENTVLLLLNALYFKGQWKQPFLPNRTEDDIFYRFGKYPAKVPFMNSILKIKYLEDPNLNASIARLPYVGDKFAMYIILPASPTGLADLMKGLDPFKLREILPKMEEMTVSVKLPKFNFDYAVSLAEEIKKLGITDMFSSKADLTGIAESHKELLVTNLIQKAGLEINEQGSAAYVSTAAELADRFGDYVTDFNVTHPFLLFIEDDTTKTVVFVGKVVDPQSSGKLVHTAPKPEAAVALSSSSQATADERFISHEFSYFDIELLQELNAVEKKNWVTSPASIKTTLGLLLEGAAGDTLEELCNVLRLPTQKQDAQRLIREFQAKLRKPANLAVCRSLNRVLLRNDIPVNPTYQSDIKLHYNTQVESVDFSNGLMVSANVNSWANNVTEGIIPELVDAGTLNKETSLTILNAIYFNGDWKSAFNPSATVKSCFYTSDGKCQKTDLMQTTGVFRTGSSSSLNARIVEIPYTDPRYSMVIVLPGLKNGLHQTTRNLPFTPLLSFIDDLPFTELSLALPKFTIESTHMLNPTFQKLGFQELFSDSPNLSGIYTTAKKNRPIQFIHKAKIVVNEKGTIAGGGTAAYVETLKGSASIPFIVNHPFVFFIKDTETGFLFEGIFNSPEAGDGDNAGATVKSGPAALGMPLPKGTRIKLSKQ